jgi:hypothetical protein
MAAARSPGGGEYPEGLVGELNASPAIREIQMFSSPLAGPDSRRAGVRERGLAGRTATCRGSVRYSRQSLSGRLNCLLFDGHELVFVQRCGAIGVIGIDSDDQDSLADVG